MCICLDTILALEDMIKSQFVQTTQCLHYPSAMSQNLSYVISIVPVTFPEHYNKTCSL